MPMSDDEATEVVQLLLSIDRPVSELLELLLQMEDDELRERMQVLCGEVLQSQFAIFGKMRASYPHLHIYN